jgi:1-deoxy-D-xylulose-5-phosphate synthase
VAIEEHAQLGGFSSAVVEKLTDLQISFSRVLRLGVPDAFQSFGAREQLLKDCGLDAESIAARVRDLVLPATEAPRAFKAVSTLKS